MKFHLHHPDTFLLKGTPHTCSEKIRDMDKVHHQKCAYFVCVAEFLAAGVGCALEQKRVGVMTV